MTGGYKIIDFAKCPAVVVGAVSDFATLDGVYDAIEETKKPLLFENFRTKAGNTVTEHKSFFAVPQISGTDFVFAVSVVDELTTMIITITDDDEIKVLMKEIEIPEDDTDET